MLNILNPAKITVTEINICLTAVFILFSVFTSAHSEPLQVPPMGNKETGSFITSYKDGGVRWKADWTMEQFEENKEKRIKLVLKGKGINSPFTEETTWEAVSTWKTEAEFQPIDAVTTYRDMSGEVIMTEKKTFDSQSGVSVFERFYVQKDNKLIEQFETRSGALILEGIVLALRTLPFSTQESVTTNLLTNEPELYKVEFEQKGVETIKTPQGEIECYKVELIPKLGLLGVFKVFFPKTHFWLTVEAPHRWVRYEGLENGLGTPEVVMEVTKFDISSN